MKLRKVLSYKLFGIFFALLGYLYIKLVYHTSKWQIIFSNDKEAYFVNRPIIYAFWHGRLSLMPCFILNKNKVNVVISSHRDGQLTTRIMKYFNFNIINTKNNNISALRKIITTLQEKENIAITPDSARRRGPRMKVSGNIISIAKKTSVDIIPVSFSLNKNIFLKSWDRFLVPLPFGKGVFIYGTPISVPRNANSATEDEYKTLLENELNRITLKADKILNINLFENDNL